MFDAPAIVSCHNRSHLRRAAYACDVRESCRPQGHRQPQHRAVMFQRVLADLSLCWCNRCMSARVAPNPAARLCQRFASFGGAIPILRRQADHAHSLRNL
jgi:hypothetical protein